MRRVSKIARKRQSSAAGFRKELIASVGKCESCGTRRQLCCHEIAGGPDRQKALDKAYALLVLCWPCNQSMEIRSVWPQARQLALMKASRPEQFDLVAFNYLVNPRAPNRITADEVAAHSEQFQGASK